MSSSLEHALAYWDAGFNIIPCTGKIPAVSTWKALQTTRATRERVANYFTDHPNSNVGIITGAVSNITVLDFDIHEGDEGYDEIVASFLKDFQSPLMVKTGSGGYHVYYKYSPDTKNAAGIAHPRYKLDVRSEGGFVVAPPSIHPKTLRPYRWHGGGSTSAFDLDLNFLPELRDMLPELPQLIRNMLGFQRRSKLPEDWRNIVYNTKNGMRNSNLAAMLGKFLGAFPPQEWYPIIYPLMQAWNNTYVNPPLPEQELKSAFESIAKTEITRREADQKKRLSGTM